MDIYYDQTLNVNDRFVELCKIDNTIVLEHAYFHFHIDPTFDPRYMNDLPFRTACKHGSLNSAIWIYENVPNIDLDTVQRAFVDSCLNRQLSIVQWMYETVDRSCSVDRMLDLLSILH